MRVLAGDDGGTGRYDLAFAISFAPSSVPRRTPGKFGEMPPGSGLVRTVRIGMVGPERTTDVRCDRTVEAVVARLPD